MKLSLNLKFLILKLFFSHVKYQIIRIVFKIRKMLWNKIFGVTYFVGTKRVTITV